MQRKCLWIGFLLTLLFLPAPQVFGRDIQPGSDDFEEVVVFATRIPTEITDLPFAAGRVGREEIQLARQQLGLDEALATIPGLFFQNRYNFAQDLRIAIRGFGARANFGIRGIRIFSDDIPLTLPDGQGSVDAIDLGSAEQIEVIRGPFSAVYGAASGGVINIRTQDGPETPFVSGRLNLGSYGYRQVQAKIGGQSGRWNWLANVSTTRLDGYRDHAEYRSDLLNSKFRYDFSDGSQLTLLISAVDQPEAQDPGGLNADEVAEDRRQAAPRNLLYNAGEALDQQTLGLTWHKEVNANQVLMLRTYHVSRDFSNRLPFSVNSNGQGARYELALFHIDVKDAIVPFELAGSGQSFFENAGRSTHRGLEAALSMELLPALTGSVTYTWSDFTFDEFRGVDGAVFDGNAIPGIPEHLFNIDLAWSHSSGFYAGWDVLYAGKFYADNANQVETGDYLVSNLRAGYRKAGKHWEISPFVGINNLFDEKYIGNVRLNASFGRYYEPAPQRNIYAGILISHKL